MLALDESRQPLDVAVLAVEPHRVVGIGASRRSWEPCPALGAAIPEMHRHHDRRDAANRDDPDGEQGPGVALVSEPAAVDREAESAKEEQHGWRPVERPVLVPAIAADRPAGFPRSDTTRLHDR